MDPCHEVNRHIKYLQLPILVACNGSYVCAGNPVMVKIRHQILHCSILTVAENTAYVLVFLTNVLESVHINNILCLIMGPPRDKMILEKINNSLFSPHLKQGYTSGVFLSTVLCLPGHTQPNTTGEKVFKSTYMNTVNTYKLENRK